MDGFSLPGEPPDSPTGRQVRQFWDDVLPVTHPVFDHPPTQLEMDAVLQEILEWDPYADDQEENGVEKQESDAFNLERHGGCLVAKESIVGSKMICCEATQVGSGRQGVVYYDHHVQQNDADQLQLPALPPDCNSCERFRLIIHCNGMVTKTTEIHRRINSLYHLIICTTHIGTVGVPVTYHNIFELQHFEMAEPLLGDYFRHQEEEGYNLVYDSNNKKNKDKHIGNLPSASIASFQPSPKSEGHASPLMNVLQPFSSSRPPNDVQKKCYFYVPSGEQIGFPKSRLTLKRERTAKMNLDDLKSYMHLPMAEAGKRLDICPTVLTKICKRNGLRRWPYRKIRAIDRSIAAIVQGLEKVNDHREKSRMLREIDHLNNDKEFAYHSNSNDANDSEENDDN